MCQNAKEKRYSNNRGGRAYFERAVRVKCPHCGLCPITINLNKAWLAHHDDPVRLDKPRAYQETNEFKDRYRWRSGVEATNSQLSRIGLKRLRVRGLKSARFKITFKALALNVKRVTKYMCQKSAQKVHNI
jgi:hypothetical protein